MATWTTLTAAKTTAGSIANWVNRSDLPTTEILVEAEAFIYERLRVREMTAVATFTFSDGASSGALPSDFLDPLEFLPYEWSDPLPFVHEQKLGAVRDADGNLEVGTPSRWTIIGVTAHVDVECDADFSGKLMYYARPAALSADNTTNFITTRYPTLLRMACMHKAFEHMKDWNSAAQYMQLAEAKMAEAAITNDLFRRSQIIPY